MKKSFFCFAVVLVVLFAAGASADPARFYNSDKNQSYHSTHLQRHIGSQACKVSGNYIKIRTEAGGKKVVGHLEQADVFSLDEISDHWARITVLFSAKTSPDSKVGMSGWVDADYVECPCSSDEYYNGPARTTYSLATVTAKTANLREEPTKSSPNHAKIRQGEQVQIISEYTGKDKKLWYRVKYGQRVGFIRNDMVEITQTDLGGNTPQTEVTTVANFEPRIDPIPLEGEQELSADWQTVYHDFLLGGQYCVRPESTDDPDLYVDIFGNVYDIGEYSSAAFGLYDMDRDGTPELIANNGYPDGGWSAAHVYTVIDGRIAYIGSESNRAGGPSIVLDENYPGIVTNSGNMGFFGTVYSELLQTGSLTSENVYEESYFDEDENGEQKELDEPIITIETSDSRLVELIRGGYTMDIAWYEAKSMSESTWPDFIASAFRNWAELAPAPCPSTSDDTSRQGQDGYYEADTYNTGEAVKYIPVWVYSDTEIYHAGQPITFKADILGGMPPFNVMPSYALVCPFQANLPAFC